METVVLVHGAFADGSCYAKVIQAIARFHGSARSDFTMAVA
jgi:hypothetical protein